MFVSEMFVESFVKGLGKATAAVIVVGSVLSIVLREPSKTKTKKTRAIPKETQTQTEEDLEMDSIDNTTENTPLPSSISFKQLFDHKFM
jgi:hypothetical protein